MGRGARAERGREAVESGGAIRRLAVAQAAHAAGDAMVAVALADTLFFAVPVGQARDKVALYLVLTMAPFAVLSPLVGPLLDRWRDSYRWAIVVAGAARVGLAVLLSTRTGGLSLYPLAFGLLVMSRAHGVSRSALVPEVLPPERSVMWGNAWLAVVSVAGGAAGAGVAAGLNVLSGARLSLLVAALVFGALAVTAVRLPPARPDREVSRDKDYRALLSSRLLAGGVAMATSRGAVGFLTFLLAFVLRAEGEGVRSLALVVAAAGVGGFAGSVLAPALRAVMREPVLLLTSLAAMAVTAWWAAGSFSVTSAAVVAATVGAGTGAGRLAFDSLLQREAPGHVRGRTFSRYETIFQLWWVGGAAVATVVPFRAGTGLRALAALCAAGLVVSARGLLRRPPRQPD
ncbi:MAG: MFS transporter [Actinomycetota bacterium]